MKYLLFIVLLVAVVIAAGCMSGNQNTPVTPTPQIIYVKVTVTPTLTYSSPLSPQSSETHFSGSGDVVKPFSVSGGGGFIFTGSYSGSRNFQVEVDDNNGDMVELPFNTIGPYTGQTVMHLRPGKYFLTVKASGPWTVDVSPT